MIYVLVNLIIVLINVGILAISIKAYSEVLKVGHIDRIGK